MSTIRQETQLSFTLPSDVMNVMYFNNRLVVQDSEDNTIQVTGIEPSELMYLFRNLLCTSCDAYDPRGMNNSVLLGELKEYFTNLEID